MTSSAIVFATARSVSSGYTVTNGRVIKPRTVGSALAIARLLSLDSDRMIAPAPFSMANNWSASTSAYINFMKQLLQWSGGNVRQALAAYNAGQGNWQAGLGYADQILSDSTQ